MNDSLFTRSSAQQEKHVLLSTCITNGKRPPSIPHCRLATSLNLANVLPSLGMLKGGYVFQADICKPSLGQAKCRNKF
ncbi:uncharacterized protein [Aegilops tauschii subsp. strangulata]|uniref:uncharacterized protein isoform X5 n=1 Tax=Aegilops tauschii subsp. strangulata TaxID=200361 RepID=UPI003CC8A565